MDDRNQVQQLITAFQQKYEKGMARNKMGNRFHPIARGAFWTAAVAAVGAATLMAGAMLVTGAVAAGPVIATAAIMGGGGILPPKRFTRPSKLISCVIWH